MSLSEKLDYTHRRLMAANDLDQELALMGEFLTPLGRGETFVEMVRFFTTRLDDVVLKLRQLTAQNKIPGYIARVENPQVWTAFGWTVFERKLPLIGRQLFVAMYDFQIAQQNELRQRCYKGISLQNLGWIDYLLGEYVSARKLLRLAILEEVFNTIDMDENTQLRIVSSNPAYLMLRQALNVPVGELDAFIRFARDFGRRHPERRAYPEDCYVSYLRAGIGARAIDQSARVSHFNSIYFTTLLDMAARATTPEAADALISDLAAYMFASVDDFEICENSHASANGFSLMIRNGVRLDATLAGLGPYLAIEWRHWLRDLRVEDLVSIGGKLRLAGLTCGVIFTRDPDNPHQTAERLRAAAQRIYQQDGVLLLIIKQTDLVDIQRGQIDLPFLLRLKAEMLRVNSSQEISRPYTFEIAQTQPTTGAHIGVQPLPIIPTMNPPAVPAVSPHLAPMLPPAQAMVPSPIMPHSPVNPVMPPAMPIQPARNYPPPQPPQPPQPPPSQGKFQITHDSARNMAPPQPAAAPIRPPRLVIRSGSSRLRINEPGGVASPTNNMAPASTTSANIGNVNAVMPYKPSLKNEPPLLHPCTTCQNQTSLSCKSCGRAFCNVHVNMSAMRCEECLADATVPAPGLIDKLPIQSSAQPAAQPLALEKPITAQAPQLPPAQAAQLPVTTPQLPPAQTTQVDSGSIPVEDITLPFDGDEKNGI